MEVRENVIVPLGYGKFVRSDKIIALEPIENDRGPGRRTLVYDEIIHIGPMLRKSIKKEAQLDLDKTQRRIEEILKHEIEYEM